MTLLSIKDLSIEYGHGQALTRAVDNAALDLKAGETTAVVGESGSGKSTLALAVMGLLPQHDARVRSGRIEFNGKNLLEMPPEDLRRIRGKSIAMIFQDPFSSLNPVMTIHEQLWETLRLDEDKPDPQNIHALLKEVQLADTDRIRGSYPHQLSGGQRQRVMIAMALARSPQLLIADEPTTALDVLVQNEILALLKKIQTQRAMAMLFVTHNLGLVKSVADRVAVMKKGELVETGPTPTLLSQPKHPYTQGLLACIPKLQASRAPLPVWDEGAAP